MNALILFSHGSLLCGSGEALDAHVARLSASGEYDFVAPGYLNYTEPSFSTAVARAVDAGADTITVAPYFLAPGYFVKKSLPDAIASTRESFPNLTFQIAPTLGVDERLVDAILDAASGAKPPDDWREPLRRASNSCRQLDACPLFGTELCPTTAGRTKSGLTKTEATS